MKGGNVLVLSHSRISNTPSSSNDFKSTYRENPSVPFPPWKDQPGEAAQGHPGGKYPPKSPGSPPPVPAPAPMQAGRNGIGWHSIGWDRMGWPLCGLLGVRFFISTPVPSAAEAAGRVSGPGRRRWEPRCGQHTGRTEGSGGRKAPAEVLGEGSRDRPGEQADGSRSLVGGQGDSWGSARVPSRPRREDGNNKQIGKDVRLRWSRGRRAAMRCSRRHRSRALANSFFFSFFFLFCSAPQVVF